MKKNFNIAIVGLGQIGAYLYNELNTKKKDILIFVQSKKKDIQKKLITS